MIQQDIFLLVESKPGILLTIRKLNSDALVWIERNLSSEVAVGTCTMEYFHEVIANLSKINIRAIVLKMSMENLCLLRIQTSFSRSMCC